MAAAAAAAALTLSVDIAPLERSDWEGMAVEAEPAAAATGTTPEGC